ncbi:MAG: STAS domain-containing protein [Candidatus Eremiobacteraeota bacterium]|nr:STAS domain-containing protein [Candidatus Eremiobacteraeota bacterium]
MIVTLSGELDIADKEKIDEALAPLRNLSSGIVDLSGVTYLDSTVIGAAVALHRDAIERGARIVFVKPPPNVMRLFDMTQLSQVLKFYDTVDQAAADVL